MYKVMTVFLCNFLDVRKDDARCRVSSHGLNWLRLQHWCHQRTWTCTSKVYLLNFKLVLRSLHFSFHL